METTPPLDESIESPKQSSLQEDYIEFVDLAAHELDAPLRKLSTLTGRLTDKFQIASQDKDVQLYADRIDHCLKDMRALVNDMSMLAKVASGLKEYHFHHIDAVIKQVLQELNSIIQSRNAVIHISSLPFIKGDIVQYKELFKNLLSNALKFRKEDTAPEIHIVSAILTKEEKTLLGLAGDKIYHRIEIADNGIGFKSEHAGKIFRPFVRLNGKSQFPGTGIGLAVCRRIVENHNGIIYAEGREGQGSSFILVLPETH